MRSGFTLIRNGESFGYPYKESLRTLAPLVDEIVIAVGNNTDNTLEALQSLARELPCPLRLIDSPWDAENQKGGFELSRQTNIALEHCQHDVCFYLQGDELLFDEQKDLLHADLQRFEKDDDVDGLALHWLHFYGNYSTVVKSRKWYRWEIRGIKKSRSLESFGDAMGFRKRLNNGELVKPRAALSRATVGHYGWVRPPQVMAKKSEAMDRLWHGNERDGSHRAETMYHPIFGMEAFTGKHPAVLHERIAAMGNDNPFKDRTLKKNFEYYRQSSAAWIEKISGWRPGEYRGFELTKRYDRSAL